MNQSITIIIILLAILITEVVQLSFIQGIYYVK